MQPTAEDTDRSSLLRAAGLRVTRPRLAVLDTLARHPHSTVDTVLHGVRSSSSVSMQAVYDVLNTLTERGVVRRVQPAGAVARYELHTGDNHHHLVCRSCGSVLDVECAVGEAPCLDPHGLGTRAPGFLLEAAEVTYWGFCASCQGPS